MAEQRLQEQEPQVHKRRVRYKGKYPRKFSEKYKELNPEQYGEAVSHVISKGNTPAGMHIPIMVEEILQVLNIQLGERGFDGTLGYSDIAKEVIKPSREECFRNSRAHSTKLRWAVKA